MRYIVVGDYFTTAKGPMDLGYIGNVPLQTYPAISEAEKNLLDEELAKLGINVEKPA